MRLLKMPTRQAFYNILSYFLEVNWDLTKHLMFVMSFIISLVLVFMLFCFMYFGYFNSYLNYILFKLCISVFYIKTKMHFNFYLIFEFSADGNFYVYFLTGT